MSAAKGPRPPLGLPPAPLPEGFPGRVDFVTSATRLSEAPALAQPEVCFCGRSNVGKSSLINTLCNRRQLARVSSTPGRTRLINFFNVQDQLTLVDLPGFGWAKVPASMQAEWGKHIQGYLSDRPQLVLALLLLDIRRDPQQGELDLLSWFAADDRQVLIVATKADKLPKTRRQGRIKELARALEVPASDIVPFSALSREGRDNLWGTILARTAAGGAK